MNPIESLRAEVRALRAEQQTMREQQVAIGRKRTAKSSALGDDDALQTSDDTADSQRPTGRIEPFGFRSRTPSKLRSLSVRIGTSNVVYVGIAPNRGYGPTDLDDGEAALYNITKAVVRLWKSGKLTIDADAGQDVVVNGGALAVARKTDKTVADATMTTWITKVTAVAAAIDNTIVAPTDFGVINGGATHFKG